MTKAQKITASILVTITIINTLAILRWIYGMTSGFNRIPDLIQTILIVIAVVPLLAMVIISIAFTASVKTSKKETRYVAPIVLGVFTALIAGYILSIPMNTDDRVVGDTMRPTDDGLFEYRVEIINPFQRNTRIRVLVREESSQEEILIYLNIPAREIGGHTDISGNTIWARMESLGMEGQYVLRFPAGLSFRNIYINGISYRTRELFTVGDSSFLIDIPNRTATRIE